MRKLIKAIILWIGSVVKHDAAPKIVFYHDIGTAYTPMGTDVKTFISHMNVLGIGDRCRGDVVAFDDGFRGTWDHRDLLPRGTKIFIAVGLVGMPGYLTWDEIRTLSREYGVDFLCHTWSHQTLIGPWNDEVPRAERTESWYEQELVKSKAKLEEELNLGVGGELGVGERCRVDELCFPVGYFSDEVIERCKKAGYKKVYASYPGNITDDYIQPRCLVQDLSPLAFRAVLNGGMNVFKNRYYNWHHVV